MADAARVRAGALPPGATIGILGGGQLGRMLATAAAELGFACHIYCPDPESPAFDVARARTVAAYDDADALRAFAGAVDVVTYEFENVPGPTAALLAGLVPVRPSARSLEVAQDRLAEKRFAGDIGAATAACLAIDTAADFSAAAFDGRRHVLKTRRLGYDGKGQAIVGTRPEAEAAFERFGGRPCLLEAFVPFEREVSVVLARGADGTAAAFEPAENVHKDHILWQSRVPATLAAEAAAEAIAVAGRFAAALDHVGVLAVEFFVTGEAGTGRLLVNEIAPRVHNSGHWTQDGATVSQFEQHIRAVAGWPLSRPATLAPTVMTNLIGADADAWADLAAEPGARLHLYGKRETRPGRKMGHVNRPTFA
jgi:5-(carboxyamino)imidazole ribonucleotide synthase